MAFNKLESSNNQEIISEEVGILKELLDDATRGMAGGKVSQLSNIWLNFMMKVTMRPLHKPFQK